MLKKNALFTTQQVQASKDEYFIKERGSDVRDTILDIIMFRSTIHARAHTHKIAFCPLSGNLSHGVLAATRCAFYEVERIIETLGVRGWLGCERAAKLIFSMRNNPSDCEESIPRDRMYAALIHPRAPQFAMHKGRRARSRRAEGEGVGEILMPPINALNVTLIAISRSPVGLCSQINIVCRSRTHERARAHVRVGRAGEISSLHACLANISVPRAHPSLRSRSARIITN